ncbi:sulfurtransferase-like selenium metabolism protein YedF [Desulfofalx alkaliphila]|uniref:sulfurtransferase-like selenium metabolism protein YedF n=1 Tax=Desulfofalx alkaliphila TaxID=105483 RepID=UPI0004E14FED|nr:sulfurtransferase-like selenium metabolism protein YedF [Desulfofalx alkaliphila]
MSYREIDNCKLACPQPVINTKKALEEIEQNGTVVSVVDNRVAKENVTRFAQNAGYEVSSVEKEGKFFITIKKGEGAQPFKTESGPEAAGGTIYSVTTDSLGQGPPELGFVLMKAFMKTINELSPPPAAIIFMNTGVKLACKGSAVLEDLTSLQQKGAEILACGTCLDFFGLKDELKVGKVSNMFEIVEKMGSGKVITIA